MSKRSKYTAEEKYKNIQKRLNGLSPFKFRALAA